MFRAKEMQEAIDAILAEQRAVAQVTEGRRLRRVLGEERSVELEHPGRCSPWGCRRWVVGRAAHVEPGCAGCLQECLHVTENAATELIDLSRLLS